MAKKARKVISKDCEEAVDRFLSAVDALPEEFTTLRPDIVRGLLNNAGTKQWSLSSILGSMYTNSLLASTGMFGANIASAMNQGVIHAPKSMIRNGVANSVAAFMAVMGRDAQLFTNMARYFLSALDFNGSIAVRLFILSHLTYVKGIGSCRQRTASAFGCVLRGATGDVVVVGRTVVSKGGKGVDDSTCRRRRDGD